jgi:hypothetical protein
MKVPSFPAAVAAFHALALAFFGGCTAWLVLESRQLLGYLRPVELVVAAAAGVLTLLALRALVALALSRTAVPLRSRTSADNYFAVLVAVCTLAVVGTRFFVLGGRPALATFCLGLGAWLFLLGFHVVPALLLASGGFIDNLGKRTRFEALDWFSLQTSPPIADEPPRAFLRAGRGPQVRVQARLVGKDAERVRKALTDAGVPARPR